MPSRTLSLSASTAGTTPSRSIFIRAMSDSGSVQTWAGRKTRSSARWTVIWLALAPEIT